LRTIGASGNHLRERYKAVFEISSQQNVIVAIGDSKQVLDYDLALFPADADVPTPYLKGPNEVQELTIGQKSTAQISGNKPDSSEQWYSVTLDANDYEFIVEMSPASGSSGFYTGTAKLFGTSGESLNGGSGKICSAAGTNQVETCSARMSLAEERTYLIQLTSSQFDSLKTGLTVKEMD